MLTNEALSLWTMIDRRTIPFVLLLTVVVVVLVSTGRNAMKEHQASPDKFVKELNFGTVSQIPNAPGVNYAA